jgi:hypothetical protein
MPTAEAAHTIATGANAASESASASALAALEQSAALSARVESLEKRPQPAQALTDEDARQGVVEMLRREGELRAVVAGQEVKINSQGARLTEIENLLMALKANLEAKP